MLSSVHNHNVQKRIFVRDGSRDLEDEFIECDTVTEITED